MTAHSSPDGRLDRALSSLRGLSVGDALGSQFFVPANYPLLGRRELPPGTWHSLVALEPGTVWFEVKAGPYAPPPPADVAAWAPAPGSPEAPRYLEHMLGLAR